MINYIFHIGSSGFPSNNAASQRIRLTFKGLKKLGFSTFIINKQSLTKKKYKKINRFDGIPFLFTSTIHHRPDSFVVRNLNKLSGSIFEFFLLYKKRKNLHTAILYTASFAELFYYHLLSRLFHFKMIVQYVEFRSSLPERNTFLKKVNDYLFDNFFYKFCDGVIAISNFLVEHSKGKNINLPVLKLPAVCDFSENISINPYKTASYLMYCGSIVYSEVIDFILDIFTALKNDNKYEGNLILVLSGDFENDWKKIREKIEGLPNKSQIIIKSNISYADLLSLYKGADILMIPLRDTVQDNARFPHKVGEYSAAKRPILSTNIGELKAYFKNGVSAILANDYTVQSYLTALSTTLCSKETLDSIGKEGYKIGLKNFDYEEQALQLKKFIEAL